MTFHFRPAKRESVPLIIALSSPSGGGKTWSALELATGMSGGKRFAVIDTENRRALHYAEQFDFEHAEFAEPFRPGRYAEVIRQADDAGYPVIVVDQMSHEHAGPGGILDWHDEILRDLIKRAKDRGDNRPEWKLADAYKMKAWIEPKGEHKNVFVNQILRTRAHLIFCFRAEPKIKMERKDGKMVIEPADFKSATPEYASGVRGWSPICEKNLIFEMTLSLLMLADNPGVPIPIKLQQQHRGMVPLDKTINRHAGEALAKWAAGGVERGSSLDEVLATIEKAQTPAELKALGPGIKKAGLNKRDTEKARKAYSVRAAEIKKSKSTPDEVEGM